MGVIIGLASVKDELAKRPSGDFEDKVPAKWVQIKPKGDPVKLVFLNEIDEGSPNYSAKNGLAIFSLQHTSPTDWKKNAACTADEGDCYGCAQGWKQKIVFYINALVDDGENEPYVAIFSRGLGKGSVTQALLDIAADEEFGNSVTDKRFKFSRSGTTKDDTTYTLTSMPLTAKGHGVKVEDQEVYDLAKYVFTVAPERQEAYYTGGVKSDAAVAAPTTASVNNTW